MSARSGQTIHHIPTDRDSLLDVAQMWPCALPSEVNYTDFFFKVHQSFRKTPFRHEIINLIAQI